MTNEISQAVMACVYVPPDSTTAPHDPKRKSAEPLRQRHPFANARCHQEDASAREPPKNTHSGLGPPPRAVPPCNNDTQKSPQQQQRPPGPSLAAIPPRPCAILATQPASTAPLCRWRTRGAHGPAQAPPAAQITPRPHGPSCSPIPAPPTGALQRTPK